VLYVYKIMTSMEPPAMLGVVLGTWCCKAFQMKSLQRATDKLQLK